MISLIFPTILPIGVHPCDIIHHFRYGILTNLYCVGTCKTSPHSLQYPRLLTAICKGNSKRVPKQALCGIKIGYEDKPSNFRVGK